MRLWKRRAAFSLNTNTCGECWFDSSRCVAAVHCASDSVRTRESVCVSAKSDGESAGSRKAVSCVRSEKTVMLFTMSAMEPKAPTTRLSLERLE